MYIFFKLYHIDVKEEVLQRSRTGVEGVCGDRHGGDFVCVMERLVERSHRLCGERRSYMC